MRKVLTVLLLLVSASIFGANDLTPVGYVNDYVDILTPEEELIINQKLSSFEKETGIEIAIVNVSSLNGEEIETFSNKLFHDWGIGKEGANNGLLVVIAPNERKWRVEVGYGLEPFMTDLMSKRIGEQNFPENFRSGNYFAGLNSFSDATIKYLGKISWEDRKVLAERAKEASDAKKDKIINIIVSTILSLTALALMVLLTIFIVKKKKKDKAFCEYKQKFVDDYNDSIEKINSESLTYRLPELFPNKGYIDDILGSKTEDLAIYNHNSAMNSLNGSYALLNLLSAITENKKRLKTTFNALNNLELNNDVHPTEEVLINWNSKDGPDALIEKKHEILNLTNVYEDRISKLKSYENIKGYKIDDNLIDTYIDTRIKYFKDEKYNADSKAIEQARIRLKAASKNFNNEKMCFDNLLNLLSAKEDVSSTEESIRNYFQSIETKNTDYKKMVSELKNADEKIKIYISKLSSYLKESDVSSDTKDKIKTVISIFNGFEQSDDIYASYKVLSDSYDLSERIIKFAQSDIEQEESRRRRKRREEEEETERVRRNSYSSSYGSSYDSSYSSSDSSSFGGFGGGDSGGGGASGGW